MPINQKNTFSSNIYWPDQTAIKLLQQGKFIEWNEYRKSHFDWPQNTGVIDGPPNLYFTNLERIDLHGIDLTDANLNFANFDQANLEGAILTDVKATQANFHLANLKSAVAKNAWFHEANFSYATLWDVDCTHADFDSANLHFTNFLRAKLKQATFTKAFFTRTYLKDADLAEAQFGETMISNVDFSETINLAQTEHRSPSSISIDSILSSKGNITAEFLRGCGVPDWIVPIGTLSDPALTPNEVSNIVSEEVRARVIKDIDSIWQTKPDLSQTSNYQYRSPSLFRYHFFVSYTKREDEVQQLLPFVEDFIESLRNSGFTVAPLFFDLFQLGMDRYDGLELSYRLKEALHQSICMISFISPGYLESKWCKFEWYSMEGLAPFPLILPIIWKDIDWKIAKDNLNIERLPESERTAYPSNIHYFLTPPHIEDFAVRSAECPFYYPIEIHEDRLGFNRAVRESESFIKSRMRWGNAREWWL